ncbi:hypothetical protein [Flavobacterium ginsengisoli]|uniref:hypothetical protein n=1 Tax=Flavobacterium ginsengisoli TaxID=871694 RepID=UPI0024153E29|nr:hypothetical protein [Flavobacterium ginsengisoli]
MKIKNILILGSLTFLSLVGCTNIDENVYDKYPQNDFYNSPEGADVALASVYGQIGGNWDGKGYAGADNGWYDLNCMSADEQVIPHRNTGDWQLDFARVYMHQWLPTDLMVNNTWNWLYKSIFSRQFSCFSTGNRQSRCFKDCRS